MKFYSEQLKQFFDTPELCLEAEQKATEQKESAKAVKARYAKAIQDAEAEIREARIKFNEAHQEAKKLKEEYDAKIKQLIDPAKEVLLIANKKRVDAIREFNKRYGLYTTTYTGDRALEEFNNIFGTTSLFDSLFRL